MVSLSTIIFGLTCIGDLLAQRCSKIVTRREIRDLSRNERTRFFNAIKKLHSGKNIFEGFTNWHIKYDNTAHRNSAFLPWHRKFIHLYEQNLQKIDPSIVLPYWDWTRDYKHPEKSIIFTKDYFGGNGRRGDKCVVDGAFANWNLVVPDRHCLRRDFKNGNKIPSLSPPEVIEALISKTSNYDEFRRLLEYPSHAMVHNNLGGSYGDFSKRHSPNDPIFYLHNAFVDLIWNEWQTRNPHLANTYNGGNVMIMDVMPPFNTPVHTMFRTTDLCYRYPRFKARLPSTSKGSSEGVPESEEIPMEGVPFEDGHDEPASNSTSRPFSKMNSFIDDLDNEPKPDSSPMSQNIMYDGEVYQSYQKDTIINPEPLSEQFIRDNRLNRAEVRANEKLMKRLVQSLNRAQE